MSYLPFFVLNGLPLQSSTLRVCLDTVYFAEIEKLLLKEKEIRERRYIILGNIFYCIDILF